MIHFDDTRKCGGNYVGSHICSQAVGSLHPIMDPNFQRLPAHIIMRYVFPPFLLIILSFPAGAELRF
jgi:hypothetical protein